MNISLSLWSFLGIPRLHLLPSFLWTRWIEFEDSYKPIFLPIMKWGYKVTLLTLKTKNFNTAQLFQVNQAYTHKHRFPSLHLNYFVILHNRLNWSHRSMFWVLTSDVLNVFLLFFPPILYSLHVHLSSKWRGGTKCEQKGQQINIGLSLFAFSCLLWLTQTTILPEKVYKCGREIEK